MKNYKYTIAFSLLTILLTFASQAHAQPKIAVVDMQRAINETQDGRTAKAKLKEIFDQRQKALDEKQNMLKSMKDNIDKQRNVLSRDAFQAKVEEYQKALIELQTLYADYQRELATKEAEATKSIIERMQRILTRIGLDEGYTLIIERNEAGVVFVPSSLDLTDTLIQRYNAGQGRSDSDTKNAPTPKSKTK